MTLAEVRDYLKTVTQAEHYHVGRLDNKCEKSIGVYPLKRQGACFALGGEAATAVGVKAVSILMHWSSNADATEQVAQALYDKLILEQSAVVGNHRVFYFRPLTAEPVDVGAEGSVYERVLEFEIYYERANYL